MSRKISIVIGTRPEAIKMIPVLKALEKRGIDTELISTGQHKEMLKQIFDFFEVVPHVDLNLMRPNQTLIGLSTVAFQKINEVVSSSDSDLFLVQGDTTTAQITATVAYYNKKQVGHVEAGLRTGDKNSPFPEEVNRRIISAIADYHFAPTQQSRRNLEIENVTKNVWVTGNTVIDALLECRQKLDQESPTFQASYRKILKSGNENVLITCHRRESFGTDLQHICEAISKLTAKYDHLHFVFPVHLNPNIRSVVFEELGGLSNLRLIDPVPYPDMVYLMMNSKLILTDSGGIQEEAPTLNVPVVVMRNHTERMEGIDAGCAVLVGTETANIVESVSKILDNKVTYREMSAASNPYGDGTSAEQIATILEANT